MTTLGSPGFYGKLPSRGDFVSRRLPKDFVDHWDAWLQGALAASRAALGGEWLEVYLTSPIWRFALAPGVCGEQGQIGVMMPSVDKVGRYFPLTASLACGREGAPLALAYDLEDWFGEVEDLLLGTLAETPLELEGFDERIARLAISAPPLAEDTFVGLVQAPHSSAHRRFVAPAGVALRDTVRRLAADSDEDPLRWRGVWWTQGSERVAPSMLVAAELPAPSAFVAMLDGRWDGHGWTCPVAPFATADLAAADRRVALRSASFSDPGKARALNEDSFARRDDLGVYVVADGLGGHQAGEIASRMVTSVVDGLADAPTLNERIDRLVRALGVVNGCLRVLAERQPGVELAASTVAALLLENKDCACVWAGDSRVYRLRNGELHRLSRDHSEAEEVAADNHVVTRAVGGPDPLEVDIERTDANPGDRFLLCTDGVHGEVAPEEIAAALALAEPGQACDHLFDAVMRGGAPDNLTGIVVYVEGHGPKVPAP